MCPGAPQGLAWFHSHPLFRTHLCPGSLSEGRTLPEVPEKTEGHSGGSGRSSFRQTLALVQPRSGLREAPDLVPVVEGCPIPAAPPPHCCPYEPPLPFSPCSGFCRENWKILFPSAHRNGSALYNHWLLNLEGRNICFCSLISR